MADTKRKAKTEAAAAQPVLLAYKGFESDWKCRGFQYALGETFEHKGKVKACDSGFHACEDPGHVLRYYRPNTSRFAVVEQSGEIARHAEDSKIASSRIHIKAEISLTDLIKACVKFRMDRCTVAKGSSSAEPSKVVKAEGANKAATASGHSGAATASGDYGAATASGHSGAATASGDYGAATASGYSGAATASGYYGAATASGDYGAATASGYSGAATASGRHGRARGAAGCAIFLVERDATWKIIATFSAIVGQDGIEPNVFYKLVGGKPVKVEG